MAGELGRYVAFAVKGGKVKAILEACVFGTPMTKVIQRSSVGDKVIAHFYGGPYDTGIENANLFIDAFNERENLISGRFAKSGETQA